MIQLDDLLAATGGSVRGGRPATAFQGFAFDSRLVQGGELFVAVKTERGDGHDFIAEACAKGATGVLAEQPVELEGCDATLVLVPDTQRALRQWGRFILREYGTEVIGVTGSTGKTTTKESIAHVLAGSHHLFKNPGNWNGRYGLPLALGQLQREHRLAVLEMASDSIGEIAELAALAPPSVAVVTTVQPAHLDTFGDLERIAWEKGALVRALPADGLALLNADDPRVRAMAELSRAPVLLFGFSEDAHLRATNIEVSLEGTRFTLERRDDRRPTTDDRRRPCNPQSPIPNPQSPISIPLLGRHMVYPALAAIGVALHYGMDLDEIVRRLATIARVPGRLNLLPGIGGSLMLDDSYNASPAAMRAALDVLAALPARRRVAVLGGMSELGAFTEEAHEQVGQHAAARLDRLVVKGEPARLIAQAAERAGLDAARVAVTYTTEDAVRAASEGLGEGDIVLVKGGMAARMEQVVARLLAGADARRRATGAPERGVAADFDAAPRPPDLAPDRPGRHRGEHAAAQGDRRAGG